MNNNNNFSGASGSGSPMRFTKRPRYAANSNSANSSPRYNYQNQSGYKHSLIRSSATDNFQHNQVEKNQRYFYSNTPKRKNYNQQQYKQSSSFSHKLMSPSSKISASTQNNNLSPQPHRIPAKIASTTIAGQNNQHQRIFTSNIAENTNFYEYPYNFFPSTYNGDLSSNALRSAFGVVEGISSYMWQIITSTPPPKLPQQQPPALPPLPSPEIPPLPPPPPIPASISGSAPLPTTNNVKKNKSNEDLGSKTVVKMRAKRKAMSTRYKLSKSWSEKDAILALKAEEANARNIQKDFILVIRFPDPVISREIVRSYSPDIESVHFHLNFAPRCCLIHLKPGADVEKTIDHLSKIKFGTGYLSVEIKQIPHKAQSVKLNEVDPFTLYVGNLPTTIACKTLKEHFPGANRIDIGFAQRMKYTRYAFIRYQTVHLAIEALNRMRNAEIGGRTVTVRFRRLTGTSEDNKDADAENKIDVHDNFVVSQSTVTDCEPASSGCGDVETNASLLNKSYVEKVSNNIPNLNEENVEEGDRNTDNLSTQQNSSIEANLNENNESVSLPVRRIKQNEINSEETRNKRLLNIKPEPDVDPDDVASRSNIIAPRCDNNDNTIKQEQENLALYEELFERPQTQNDSYEKSSRSDLNSIETTTDDMDAMSQLSSNSLGEFLQACQRSQTQAKNNAKDAEPPIERNQVKIKKETLEADNMENRENLLLSSNDSVGFGCVKQEAGQRIETLTTSTKNIHSITSKTAPLSKNKPTTNISQNSHNNNVNNDDIVPSTALFFTNDYHNKWTHSGNNCDTEDFYDEFYESRASPQASTSQADVKREPVNISISQRSKNEINNKLLQTKPRNRSNSVSNYNNPFIEKSNRNSAAMSNAIDNADDLVPAQNLLGSYRPSTNVIKRETECDDLFSVHLSKNIKPNADVNEVSLTSTTAQLNDHEDILEITKSHVTESNDEDVVIVSANIPPACKEKKSDSSVYNNNLFIPRLTDLVSFNYKPFSVPIPSHTVSTFLQRDHLDELYDQLDADSDSEL